jgi:hypothetical protein
MVSKLSERVDQLETERIQLKERIKDLMRAEEVREARDLEYVD